MRHMVGIMVGFIVEHHQRRPAVRGAFPAHLRTALAMGMVVEVAFLGAAFAGLDAHGQ